MRLTGIGKTAPAYKLIILIMAKRVKANEASKEALK